MNEIKLKGKTILCFAGGYDAPPTSKHYVMHILAVRNMVLWINYHASRVPTASSSDLLYMAKKLQQVIEGLKRPRKNLYVLTPLIIPLPRSPLALRLNRLLLIAQIRMALGKVRNCPTQIWSFTPDIAYALGHFSEEKVVYYCVDDHASFSGYNKAQVLHDEEELCRHADLVVTTSMALQEAKAPWNTNTILVPHGVDYNHFSSAVHEDLPCPADMVAIPRPRLGFFGLIRDWVDVELLGQVAIKRTEWYFVMIGDADSSVDLGKYRSIPNMHFLGRKSYKELPTYCRYFDVGLIPFKVNELTRAVNPIKLREYLAAGLPVISTPMPEVKLYEHLIEIISSSAEFESAVEKCLTAAESDRAARLDAMSRETWPQKVEQICEALP
jgi:glycosyltransferase involved in cell wall biosynthesis